MGPEAHLDHGRVRNGGHPHHNVKYDTIKAVPDTSQCTTNKSQSKEIDSDSPQEVENKGAMSRSNLDGGYGWVIVISSFFVAFAVDGIGSSFGLLFPYILSKFGASAFVTSFAGSMFVAFLVMGSVSVQLVKRFGYRTVAVTGSILSSISFVASVFSPNIYVFILTFGLLGGCSCGLVFIPSIVIVNEYFYKKRGMANGIIASGSGVGLLVLAPIINILLDSYSLDGTILVLAGVLLNMCVFSCLFRPLNDAVAISDKCDNDCYDHLAAESLSSNLLTDDDGHCLKQSGDDMVTDNRGQTEHGVGPGFDINEILRKYNYVYIKKLSSDPDNSAEDQEIQSQYYAQYMLTQLKSGVPITRGHTSQYLSLDRNQTLQGQHRCSGFCLESTDMHPASKHHCVHSMYDIPPPSQDKDHMLQMDDQDHKNLGQRDHKSNHPRRPSKQHSQRLSIDHGSNLYLTGNISTLMSLPNSNAHTPHEPSSKPVDCPNSNIPDVSLSEDCKMVSEKLLGNESSKFDKCIVQIGRYDHSVNMQSRDLHKSNASISKSRNTDLPRDNENTNRSMESESDSSPSGLSQLLCIPSFYFFCLGASLIQIGYPLAGAFLADYAYQFGLTTSHTAVLMGLLGGFNICGRLLAGVIVGLKVDPLLLNNISLLLGGAACLMSPLYTEFWSLCIFASMFGFFLGFFPPLQPLIIVKHFGLDSLASAFGFLSTIKGVASIIGAPLAGYIYDLTGQYSMSFIFGGVVFVLSSFVHCIMICNGKCRLQKKL